MTSLIRLFLFEIIEKMEHLLCNLFIYILQCVNLIEAYKFASMQTNENKVFWPKHNRYKLTVNSVKSD